MVTQARTARSEVEELFAEWVERMEALRADAEEAEWLETWRPQGRPQ